MNKTPGTPDCSFDPIADMDENVQVEPVFPTPIFWYVLRGADGLNTTLRDLILERERATQSIAKSNQGGWQSAPDLLQWGGPAIATLERYLNTVVRVATLRLLGPADQGVEFDMYAWAAVNRKGHYNTIHVHPMSTWSGVYYVDIGLEPGESPDAQLEFQHPVTAALMTFFPGRLHSARLVQPENGMIILFPSYLQHSVRMHDGEAPRVCVSFNAHERSGG